MTRPERPSTSGIGTAICDAAEAAVLLTVFLLALMSPNQRTWGATLYVVITALLLGATVYFRRRAMEYLVREPRPWAIPWLMPALEPKSYDACGRRFVRMQLFAMFVLVAWWTLGVFVLRG